MNAVAERKVRSVASRRPRRRDRSNAAPSWFAAPMPIVTNEPAGITLPPISTSHVVLRIGVCTGASSRMISSTNNGIVERSARTVAHSAGSSAKMRSMLPMSRVVVRLPAESNTQHAPTTSAGSRCSPSTSAVTSAEIRSSPGLLRPRAHQCGEPIVDRLRTALGRDQLGSAFTPRVVDDERPVF